MENNDKQVWEKDFVEFVSTEVASVPGSVSESVVSNVHRALNPSAARVFAKASVVHFASGLVTLVICPQFGVSFAQGTGLMGAFMKFGEIGCMVGCGALFTGLSLFIASLALKPEEVRVLKKNEILQVLLLSMVSLGAFVCIGEGVLVPMTAFWLIGAVLSGVLFLELGWNARVRALTRAVA